MSYHYQTGYIRTSQDNYYIEPAEKSSNEYPMGSFLHRIKKIPHSSAPSDNDVVTSESEQCETNGEFAHKAITRINRGHVSTRRIFLNGPIHK